MADNTKFFKYVLGGLLVPAAGAVVQLWKQDILSTVFVTLIALTAYIGLLQYDSNRNSEALERVAEILPRISRVTPIRENNFYDAFKARLVEAKHSVNLSYMNNQHPLNPASRDRKEYYEWLFKYMRRNEAIRFQRLDRGHPALREWIERVIKEMTGHSNFSYAIWLDDRPHHSALEIISIQIIDDDCAFLVAVGRQAAPTGFRDLHIESRDFAEAWSAYYQRLWSDSERCIIVIERGSVNEAGLSRVMQHLDAATAKLKPSSS